MAGFFLSLEGVDGVGKTTQLDRLTARLRAAGCEPVIAQEPGGTRIGDEIRKILLNARNADLQPVAELLLYFASRNQNIAEVIQPALDHGRLVISDRFTDATLAYQGYGRQLGAATVRAIQKVACGGLEPDMTLWLDLDPGLGVGRALHREAEAEADEDETRMEREGSAFFARVLDGYQTIHQAAPQRFQRINAAQSEDAVEAEIVQTLRPALAERLQVTI